MRVIPQDRLIFEAVQVGEIDAREAYLHLIMDAAIQVDDVEIKKISQLPEVSSVPLAQPEVKKYKPGDWRAKEVVIRDVQWQKKPVIDHIAETYKEDVIQAIRTKFSTMPTDWQDALFADIVYRLESKALQLAPSPDKKWKTVYVQLVMHLGSALEEKGFLGKLTQELERVSEGQVQEVEGQLTVQTSLTGFDSVLSDLDPYAGAEMSKTMIHGRLVADDPGYDKEIRSAFNDHIGEIAGMILGVEATVDRIDNDGKISFSVGKIPAEPEDLETESKLVKIISENIPEPPLDPPTGYYGDDWKVCDTCNGAGCDTCDFEGMLPPITPEAAKDIRAQERLDDLLGK
jgi:hypothetical protein